MCGTEVYAEFIENNELEMQNKKVDNTDITFDAYFENKKHQIEADTEKSIKIYLDINVKSGYLKNANIDMQNSNFAINLSKDTKNELIQKIDLENNIIYLNQINKGQNYNLEIPIKLKNSKEFDLNNFSKENDIKLNGMYTTEKDKNVNINKTIKLKLNWNNNAEMFLEQSKTKDITGDSEKIVQIKVKTGVVKNCLPVKETILEIQVPNIEGKKPKEVIVYANKTKATNGDNGLNFSKENYEYDKETGNLKISVKNEAKGNKISWEKNEEDEYIITYIYEKPNNENTIKIQHNIYAKMSLYSSEEKEVSKTNNAEYEINSNSKNEDIVNNLATSTVKSLNKGYMYTNKGNATTYDVIWEEGIGYVGLINEIVIEQGSEKFITKEQKEIDSENNTQFITTRINKTNFDKILGQDGEIKIYSKNGTEIATINNKTKLIDNYYTLDYDKETNYIKIKTSKPKTEGKLEIEHTKQIKANTNYTKEQIKTFDKLQLNVKQIDSNNNIHTYQINIPFEEPSTQIDAYMDKTDISTITKNENIKLNVVLKNNNVKYDLYKNPIVEIEVPKYITGINLKESILLNEDELKIIDSKISTLENGNKLITIQIEGEQTKYNKEQITGGTILAMNLDLETDELTPSKEDIIKVYVTNENAVTYENENIGKAYKEIKINYVAPIGMMTVNQISSNGKVAKSISGQEEKLEIKPSVAEKNATITMSIINNTQETVEDVKILGKFPTANNKSVTTKQSLESTFTANIISEIVAKTGINQEQINVYYTQNENATYDINNSQNAWTKNITNAKAYLILINNYEFIKGEKIEFAYDIQIPQGLKHNESSYVTYAVYYKTKNSISNNQELVEAPKVGVYTPKGVDFKVEMSSNVDKNAVQEGQIVKYNITLKNIGDTEVKNIVVKSYIPYNAIYVEKNEKGEYIENENKLFYGQILSELGKEEEKTISYEVKVRIKADEIKYELQDETNQENNLNETETVKKLRAEAYATFKEIDGNETTFYSNVLENEIKEGNVVVELSNNKDNDLSEQEEIIYTLKVKNMNEKQRTNVNVILQVPEGTELVETEKGESKNNKIVWNIGTIDGNKTEILKAKLKVKELPNGVYEKDIIAKAEVTCAETKDTNLSNELKNKVKKQGVTFKQTSSIEEEKIYLGDKITYEYIITNIGTKWISGMEIESYIPEFIKIEKANYIIDGKEYEIGYPYGKINKINYTINSLPIGKNVKINIQGVVNSTANEENTKIESYSKILTGLPKQVESNHIIHLLSKESNKEDSNEENIDENVDENVENSKYKITGTIWLDKDKNGERTEEESKFDNIRVLLIEQSTGNIVKEALTDKYGKYSFEKLKNGSYLIVFIYNSELYSVTEYQKNGISDNKNSDAMQVNIELEGKKIVGAATDVITIKDSNIYNIDLGLIEKGKFDLKLEKEISNIKVQNSEGTKSYDYKDGTKVAKVDINPKYINGTVVIITYKIKITNEGDIKGYAKNIVDYLPSDVKFSSELNSNWYQGKDGNVFTTSLANTIINEGETKEVTLVVTKQMTEENLGLVINTAEIQESYNDLAIKDTDSTPANKSQSEDDYGMANVYLSLNTGGVTTYIIITVSMITLIACGAYIINKKVLRRI